jgi:hypothetical protein
LPGTRPISLVRDSPFSVIRVYGEGGNVIQTHEHKGDFKRTVSYELLKRYAQQPLT